LKLLLRREPGKVKSVCKNSNASYGGFACLYGNKQLLGDEFLLAETLFFRLNFATLR